MKLLKIAPVLLLALVFILTGCAADAPTSAGVSNEAAPAPDFSLSETITPTDTSAADEVMAEVIYITAADAESAALTHAGVSADAALGLRSEFDLDDRIDNYDVDFCADGTEYDYEVNAVTGEIIKAEKDKCDHNHPEKPKADQNNEKSNTSISRISKAEAKSIALKHAGVSESKARHLEVEYDKDNGVFKYEVSFDYNGYEYDYDINAETGKIISYDKERDD